MVTRQLSELSIVIETDGGAIDVEQLTDFFYHFRAAYSAAIGIGALDANSDPENLAELVRQKAYGKDWQALAKLAHKDLRENMLGIIDIRRQNPLTIVFEGVLVAVTVAVILSGGKLKIGPLKANLPPLGVGIRSLRDAFGRKKLRDKKKP